MKRGKLFVFMVLSVVVLFSCATASPRNEGRSEGSAQKKREFLVYLYSTEKEDARDVIAIVIEKDKPEGSCSYSHDRYQKSRQTLVAMEFGKYKIENGSITIKAGKFDLNGKYEKDRIVIDERTFLLEKEKGK